MYILYMRARKIEGRKWSAVILIPLRGRKARFSLKEKHIEIHKIIIFCCRIHESNDIGTLKKNIFFQKTLTNNNNNRKDKGGLVCYIWAEPCAHPC